MSVSIKRIPSAAADQNTNQNNNSDDRLQVALKILPNGLGLNVPRFETEHAAGMDLVAAIDVPTTIKAHEFITIPTGISIALPHGYECQIRPRSGLAAKNGITLLNSPGTIDADYRGEIKVILINHSNQDFVIERGMRIAQMVVAKYTRFNWLQVNELNETLRGEGGFGSTGLNN